MKDGLHGRHHTLAGMPGIIIPTRTPVGLIVALVLRPDDAGEGGKYRWVSSACYSGPSPGTRVHAPAGVNTSSHVRLVEGILKANMVFALPGEATISLAGPHLTEEAIATLRALNAREALLALDADTRTSPHVARAHVEGLARLANDRRAQRLQVSVVLMAAMLPGLAVRRRLWKAQENCRSRK